jgi:hypothetical protein
LGIENVAGKGPHLARQKQSGAGVSIGFFLSLMAGHQLSQETGLFATCIKDHIKAKVTFWLRCFKDILVFFSGGGLMCSTSFPFFNSFSFLFLLLLHHVECFWRPSAVMRHL